MVKIKIEVLDAPSRSKGWARYAVSQGARHVVTSNTGNEWIGGTTKEGEAEAESVIVVTSQVQLNVGKGFRARPETSTEAYQLVVEEGAVDEIYHRPGSQGQRLRITGARRAAIVA